MMTGTSLVEALGFRWEKHRRFNLGPHSNLIQFTKLSQVNVWVQDI